MSSKKDFDDSLTTTRIALLVSGVDVYQHKTRNFIVRKAIAYLFHINMLWLHTDVLGELIWLVEGINVGKSFDELSIIAPCTTICLLATAKTVPMYLNKKGILTILDRLRDIYGDDDDTANKVGGDSRTVKGSAKSEEEDLKRATTRTLNRLTTFMWSCNSFVIMAFCFLPMLAMALDYSRTGILKLRLPFLVKFFFDPFSKMVWPFVYFHQVWSTFIVCFNIFGADTMFHAFCLYLRMHFNILCYRLENVVSSSKEETTTRLRNCVIKHQELIELVEEIEKLYSKSTLFNIIVSSVLICLSGFNIAFIQDLGAVVAFSSFLVMSTYQIFMICLFGDMIVTSSSRVCEAAYKCRWYATDLSIKRSLLIIILRSQKPCSVSAEKFATVNLRAFTTILSRSWSYFALLKTMYR